MSDFASRNSIFLVGLAVCGLGVALVLLGIKTPGFVVLTLGGVTMALFKYGNRGWTGRE